MSNFFKKMEKDFRRDILKIDWKSAPNERSIEIPWLLECIDKIQPQNMLDVGFAGGFYQSDILEKDVHYVGLDYDMSRISGQSLYVDAARKSAWKDLIKQFEWIREDIVNPEEKLFNRAFDMVVSISSIEHIVPAGYAGNFIDFDADLIAIKNMKRLVKPGGYLLLSFPVGKIRYFYNPDTNRNKEILEQTLKFQIGIHDQMFYDVEKIRQFVDHWEIVEKKFYCRNENKQWIEQSEEIACSVEHKTSEATTVCLLWLKNNLFDSLLYQ